MSMRSVALRSLATLATVAAIAASAAIAATPNARAEPPDASRARVAVAEAADSVSLQADKLDVDIASGEAVLTGKVVMTKGDLTVACPRLDLRFDQAQQNVVWARASGGISADLRGVHAEAPSAELDVARQILELRGGVKVTRGGGRLSADTARIDVANGKVSLTQVKGTIAVTPRP